jgi:hypothetical protein
LSGIGQYLGNLLSGGNNSIATAPGVAPAPLPYDLQMAQIKRQQALADAQQQQASDVIPVPMSGNVAGPISWGSVLAKALQGVTADVRQNRLQDQMQQLGTQHAAALAQVLAAAGGTPTAGAAPPGANAPAGALPPGAAPPSMGAGGPVPGGAPLPPPDVAPGDVPLSVAGPGLPMATPPPNGAPVAAPSGPIGANGAIGGPGPALAPPAAPPVAQMAAPVPGAGAGAGPQGPSQQAGQLLTPQMAAILSVNSGGDPQIQAIQSMLAQRAGTLDTRAYEQQQAQMRPATAQEKADAGLDAKTPALINAHGQITPITDPNQLTAYQQAQVKESQSTLAVQQAQQAETARHDKAEEAVAQNPFGLGIPGAAGKSGDELLSMLPPGVAAQVKAVGTYRQPAPAGRASPNGMKFMSLVNQVYPDYDSTQFTVKSKARNDFATGTQGKSILAINNAMAHLSLLGQLGDALQNNNIPLANQLKNTWLQQTGSAAPNTYEAVKNIASQEIVKSIVPGGGGEGERTAAAKNLAASSSPDALRGAIAGVRGLFAGQLSNYQRMYQKNTGLNDFNDYLSPDTAALMASAHGGAGGGAAKAPTTSNW